MAVSLKKNSGNPALQSRFCERHVYFLSVLCVQSFCESTCHIYLDNYRIIFRLIMNITCAQYISSQWIFVILNLDFFALLFHYGRSIFCVLWTFIEHFCQNNCAQISYIFAKCNLSTGKKMSNLLLAFLTNRIHNSNEFVKIWKCAK